jgi:iron complex outermembrane receptor protein
MFGISKCYRPFAVKAATLAGVSTLAMAMYVPAFAQPATDQAAEGSMDEIVVTARRIEERLQDVPISITVFNQRELTERQVNTAEDLATFTPSLAISTQFGALNPTFTLRGFVQEIGTAPTVGVYFADVVSPRAGLSTSSAGDSISQGSFFDLENIQVLKGPQGTLFGRNTTGGAILIVPRKPTNDFEGYIESSAGNYDMWRVQGVVNVPLTDYARVRLGFDRQTRNGYVSNTGTNPLTGARIGPSAFDDVDYTAVRASVILDLAPNLENYTVAYYSHSFPTGYTMSLFDCVPQQPLSILSCAQLQQQRAQGTTGFFTAQTSMTDMSDDTKVWQVVNTTTWNATDHFTVKNIFGYGQFKQDLSTPLFGTLWDAHSLNPYAPVGSIIDFVALRPIPGGHFADQETWSEEFRLSGAMFDSRFNWQGGVYYEKSDPLSTPGTTSGEFLNCVNFTPISCANPAGFGTLAVTTQPNSYRNTGIYFQDIFDITQQLKLTTGIRYTWDRISSEFSQKTYSFPYSVTPTAPSPSTPALSTQPGLQPLLGSAAGLRQRYQCRFQCPDVACGSRLQIERRSHAVCEVCARLSIREYQYWRPSVHCCH